MPIEQEQAGAVADVRGLPRVLRHTAIVKLIDTLRPGKAFVIVNDHDPAPLRAHIEGRAARGHAWDYLERGPVTWRVKVTRT